MEVKPKAKQYCIAYGCLNNNKDSTLTFFALPPNSERRRLWLKLIDREDLLQKEVLKWRSYVVCSAHFEDSSVKFIKHLKKNAVPTICINKSQKGLNGSEAESTSTKSNEIDVVMQTSLEGSACNECGVSITGFRYVCVQCQSHKLCSPCEARGAHPLHYVLRVPGDRPQEEIETTLARVRKEVYWAIQPVESAAVVPDLERVKEEIILKEEPPECQDEADPLPEATTPETRETLHTEIDIKPDKPAGEEDLANILSMKVTRTRQGELTLTLACHDQDDQVMEDAEDDIYIQQAERAPQVSTPYQVVRIPPVDSTQNSKTVYINSNSDPYCTTILDNSTQAPDNAGSNQELHHGKQNDNITNKTKRKNHDKNNIERRKRELYNGLYESLADTPDRPAEKRKRHPFTATEKTMIHNVYRAMKIANTSVSKTNILKAVGSSLGVHWCSVQSIVKKKEQENAV